MFSLQLNELRFAVWSPARAAVEDDCCAAVSAMLMKVDHVPVLVRKNNVRKARTDGRPHPFKISVWIFRVGSQRPSSRLILVQFWLLSGLTDRPSDKFRVTWINFCVRSSQPATRTEPERLEVFSNGQESV